MSQILVSKEDGRLIAYGNLKEFKSFLKDPMIKIRNKLYYNKIDKNLK